MAWATPTDATNHWEDAKGVTTAALSELLEAAYEECRAYAPSIEAVILRDAVTTQDSTTLTSAAATFSARDEGRGISGTGIPVGATVAYVVSSTELVLSAAATATGSGVEVTLAAIPVPKNYMLANVYQARDIYTASKRGDVSSDVVGVGDFAIRARPLSAVVRQLLRPQGHSLLGFA